jgi:Domain of unknown function (DUF4280)
MPKLVVHRATLRCSQGATSSNLTVLSRIGADVKEMPTGTIQDHVPMVNVAPFGMCQSPANPQVAAATAAAMGALTPQPCVPVLPSPWSPGASVVTIQGIKALSDNSKCICAWAGSIEITNPGSTIEVE